MDESLILILLSIVLFVGVLGSVLPVLPGASLSFAALFLGKLFDYSELKWWVILLFGALTLIGVVLDYLLPIITTKKMGGSKYGIVGLIIGFVVGLIFSPFGFVSIIIAPFLGAFIGELINDRSNHKKAVTAALGSVISYALTSFYGLILTLAMFFTFLLNDVLPFFK